MLGGRDADDSDASVLEGDLTTWLFMASPHAINLTTSVVYDFENHVTSAEIDSRAVVKSTEKYILTAGAGGAIYHGGSVPNSNSNLPSGAILPSEQGLLGRENFDGGRGGPILGIYFSGWQLGIDVQAGYGTSNEYGQISIFKRFDWAW